MRIVLVFIALLIPSFAFAEPRNVNPATPDQVFQNDRDLQESITNLVITPQSRTLTQLQAITPKKVGQAYYCTTCGTAAVCVSTGVAQGAFSNISGRATACN